MRSSTYLLIESGIAHLDVEPERIQGIFEALDGDPVVIGYDIHAGFYLPDLGDFAQFLRNAGQRFMVEPTFIDERDSSGRDPFSPLQVYAEVNGKPVRTRVAKPIHSTTYVSRLEVNLDTVEAAYRQIAPSLWNRRMSRILGNARDAGITNLGDLLELMHDQTLRESIGHLHNVSVREMMFDRFDVAKQRVDHSVERHRKHVLVYIGLSKIAIGDREFIGHLLDVYREARRAGTALQYIVTPNKPSTLCRASQTDSRVAIISR